MKPAGPVQVGDAPSPGSHFGDVKAGCANELSAAAHEPTAGGQGGPDLIFGMVAKPPLLDHGGLGGGSSHVEGNHVGQAHPACGGGGCQNSRRGSRLKGENGTQGSIFFGGQAPGRLHDEQGRLDFHPTEISAQRPQVATHHRAHVGIDHRCGGTLVFVALGQYLGRERNRQMGKVPPQEPTRHHLMFRVGVGMEKANGHRLHGLLLQPFLEIPQLRLPQGYLYGPVGQDTFLHLETQIALHQLPGFPEEPIIEHRHPNPPQLQDVPEPLGGDQRRFCPAALQHRIGRYRRAMGDFPHASPGSPCRAEPGPDGPGDGFFEVWRSGRHLLSG